MSLLTKLALNHYFVDTEVKFTLSKNVWKHNNGTLKNKH